MTTFAVVLTQFAFGALALLMLGGLLLLILTVVL